MPEYEQITEVTLSAVVTRADGTIEDLGVIASTEDGTVTIEEMES